MRNHKMILAIKKIHYDIQLSTNKETAIFNINFFKLLEKEKQGN